MFSIMKKELQSHIDIMLKDQSHLFVTTTNSDKLWELYLDSFAPEDNPIFCERREHDCSGCKKFIRSFGNVVSITNDKITSIWDFTTSQKKYRASFTVMSAYIHDCVIKDVFLTKENNQGHDKDHEKINDEIITWDHFYYRLPNKFVFRGDEVEINRKHAEYRDTRNVFLRSLNEITIDAVDTVLELIEQKSLYRGDEWKVPLQSFRTLQKESTKIAFLDIWAWPTIISIGPAIGRIRNHSIGVLLQDISNGIDLNDAVKKYEKIIAPPNYKRPKAIFIKKMIQNAKEKIVSLGFENSLGRRHATIEDITVNNILFANKDSIKRMQKPLNVFADLAKTVSDKLPNLERIEAIDSETFINDVLPSITEIALFNESRLDPNFVSLIAPIDSAAPTMFKWNNPFSWAYNGNIADSMKERVAKAGGNINGVLRFSIMWNQNGDNDNDFDAHAKESNGNHIYFNNRTKIHRSSGMLDVDITRPFDRIQVPDGGAAVENIVWTDKNRMPEGSYEFWVHNYSYNGGRSGFSAEIEFDGVIHEFHYDKELKQSENILVAHVHLQNRKFILKPALPSTTSSRTIWNISTMKFHRVSTIMYSPNYWNNQNGIGHRHVFFMVNECLNDSNPNGFFNEFLPENLLEHKRVFEALGSKMRVPDSDSQLSGVGFSTTKRNYVVLKVKGNFDRAIKVNF